MPKSGLRTSTHPPRQRPNHNAATPITDGGADWRLVNSQPPLCTTHVPSGAGGGVGQKAPKRNTKRSVQPSEKAFLVTGCTRGTAKAGRAQPETKTLAASRFVRVSFTPFSRYNPSSTRAIRARRGVSGFFPGLGVQETSPSTNRHGKQLCYRPV